VVLVTHEEDIAAHAKRVIRLRDGNIESDQAGADRRMALHH
jgi:putative ABC transport system ATP-binding protein